MLVFISKIVLATLAALLCVYLRTGMSNDSCDEVNSTKFDDNSVIWRKGDENEEDHNDIWDDTALIEAYDRAVSHVKEQIAKRNKVTPDSDGKNSRTSNHKRKKRGRSKNKRMWKVGDNCQAVYSEDSLPYEATIKYINNGMCTVQFLGYGNKQDVYIEDIRPSLGKEARIRQNIAAQTYNTTNLKLSGPTEVNGNYPEDTSSAETNPKQSTSHIYQQQTGNTHHQPHPPPPTWFHPDQNAQHPRQDYQHAMFAPSWTSNPFQPPPLPCHHKRNSGSRIPPMPPPPFPIEDGIVNDDEALAAMLMSWYMSGYHTGYYQGLRQSQMHSCVPAKCNNFSCSH